MGDIYIGRNEDGELTHSARGTTWTKNGASYIKREKKNGKWVYTYRKFGKFKGNGQPVDMTNATPTSEDVSEQQRFAQNEAKTRYSISNRRAQQIQSEAESMKRKSVSAQRNVQKDTRYKINAKTAYLKNKASRNINKGKKKVNEILSRLRKSASAARTNANRKIRAAKTQATIRKTQAERAAAEKRRKEANRKKYAAQAKAQRHSKNVIAREQAVGKVKRTAKAAKSYVTKGWGSGDVGKDKVKSVSKKVDKRNSKRKR